MISSLGVRSMAVLLDWSEIQLCGSMLVEANERLSVSMLYLSVALLPGASIHKVDLSCAELVD
jgi:hypothetical protein